jgi:hypothetical protein
MSAFADLLTPYVGPNEAHRRFREEFKYLNAFYYLFLSGRKLLEEHLRKNVAESDARAMADHGHLQYVLELTTFP